MRIQSVFAGVLLSVVATQTHAALVVDGTGTGSNFATLQEAVDAYLASSTEDTIQIETNSLAAGATIAEGTVLARPLTIEAAPGFTPVIDGTLTLLPDNEDQVITLNNLTIAPVAEATDAMVAGGSITANNCIFDAGPGVSWGISTANTSAGTTGNLNLTSCTLNGWYCLVVGRAIENYTLTDTWMYTDANPFQMGIIHVGNQPTDRGSGIGLGASISADETYTTATTPRTLTMDRCRIQAGKPLAWPAAIGGFPHIYSGFTDLVGPITATNTVFEGLTVDSIIWLGWFDMIAHTQTDTFTHCTFRNMSLVPDAGAPPSQPSGSTINLGLTNCLFDVPAAEGAAIGVYYYAIGGYQAGTVNFSGDSNAYNVPPFSQNGAWAGNTFTRILEIDAAPFDQVPNFETTFHERISETAEDNVTDASFHLNALGEALAADKAVDLDPVVLLDFEKQVRPGSSLNDIGADEAGASSLVSNWTIY